ncbi:MAG: DNA gyrase inhibitor YacG [Tateyamaria sp.]|jgi:endogenous inhibitor of DNA gyrase (YacG/DUF329 family)|nr:DNA gyrase inhibitor YacG [Tateyamaria sp.]MDB2579297.1 DNA gyrase inhibitor YacG [Tateyamaria sp.]MDG1183853.1 DNA gyrase inhibitor YacG [Tateyamaria sp.]MDG1334590.1 DNA gyrase inhibitor YacG [Tateyamaria sp.]MDG2055939.1 DNA gyrase inhibitor YacG [Tateyamaria sp.]
MNCPVCSNTAMPEYRPFCSRRCADVDLARWMSGSYAVPSESEEDEAEAKELATNASQKPH